MNGTLDSRERRNGVLKQQSFTWQQTQLSFGFFLPREVSHERSPRESLVEIHHWLKGLNSKLMAAARVTTVFCLKEVPTL